MAAGDLQPGGGLGGWTGTGLLVCSLELQVGDIYYPDTDSWTPISFENAPLDMTYAIGRISGGKLLVVYEDGGRHGPPAAVRYDPESDDWAAIAPPPAVSTLYQAGDALLMIRPDRPQEGAALYDPVADVWSPVCSHGAPTASDRLWFRWTGEELLMIGAHIDTTIAARLRL